MIEVDWFRQLQFIAAVGMPEPEVAHFGTTVNGMWAAPEDVTPAEVALAQRKGRRVLFSVPLIALTPDVYESELTSFLVEAVCRDIYARPSAVSWYYWEGKPVLAACIFSETFRGYLAERCRGGIDRGMDVVNLDEINTSIGLISRQRAGSGFCPRCLARYRKHVGPSTSDNGGDLDDRELLARLRSDDALYARYRSALEHEAFVVVLEFIEDLRAYARHQGRSFAISANIAYLGNLVTTHGQLWGPMWGEHVDFVMMENAYQLDAQISAQHELLPRGTFAPWYRLGSAFRSRAPTWICPSIIVPKQLAGQERSTYYLLMFLEAYANGGRWAYYWWPGVDHDTRLQATVPPAIADWTRFITAHREFYEEVETRNEIAILYLDSSISAHPRMHFSYIALAHALAAAGYQFDVIYSGDGMYAADSLDVTGLGRYARVLVPFADGCTAAQREALTKYAELPGRALTIFSPDRSSDSKDSEPVPLLDYWTGHLADDQANILDRVGPCLTSRVTSSEPRAVVTRYHHGDTTVLHILNYAYEESTDGVTPFRDLRVSMPWEDDRQPIATLLTLTEKRRLRAVVDSGRVSVHLPQLDLYAVVLLE